MEQRDMAPENVRHTPLVLQAYRLLQFLALGAVAPAIPLLKIHSRRVKEGFRHFLGKVEPAERPVLWVHGVSMGEALVASGFAAEMKKRFPRYQIAFTTTHPDVYANVRKRQATDLVAYFPLDNPVSMRRIFDRWRPAAVFVAETDFWPEFSWQCQRRNIPLILINGRISDKIARFYGYFRSFASLIFTSYSLFAVQSDSDRQKLLNLGVAPEKIHVLGNMKADLVAVKNIDVKTISEWVSDRVSFVFGSLHPSELAVLKPAITKLAARDKTAVIVAPRNPTFCKAWKKELETDGLLVELRSELPAAGSRGNILLLDTMGELAGIYSLASAAFVGGSLERSVGGHNPLEVIQQHVPLLMGPYCRNFSDIVEQLRNEGGMIQIANASEAEESIVKFIDAPAFAQQQVQAADRVLSNNTGCLQKTLEQIEFILQQAS